jgi:hypothetical protein
MEASGFLKNESQRLSLVLVTGEDASDSVILHSIFLKRELLTTILTMKNHFV